MNQENTNQLVFPVSHNIKGIILTTVCVTAFLMSFTSQSLNVAFPSISREFSATAVQLSWIAAAYALPQAAFAIPFGRLADIVGIKRMFIYGMSLYIVASITAILVGSTMMLIVCRLLQGIGGASIVVNYTAMLAAAFPEKERGRALGMNIAFVFIGASTGPFLGGILTEYFGWRSIFVVSIIAGIVTIPLLLWKIKGEWRNSQGQKIDYTGSIIYGLALVALMYGLSILPDKLGILSIVLGFIALFIFVKWENKSPSPILNFRVFKNNKAFIFSSLASLCSNSALFGVSFLLSLYLQYIQGFTPQQAGLILVTQPAIQALLSPFTGRLSDKIKPYLVASIGMASTLIGLFPLIFLTHNTSFAQVIICLVLLGIGISLFASPNINAIMSAVAPQYYGVASAAVNTMRSTGQMFSMGIIMVILAIFVGKVEITPPYYSSFLTGIRIVFGILALICLGGLLASIYSGRQRLFK